MIDNIKVRFGPYDDYVVFLWVDSSVDIGDTADLLVYVRQWLRDHEISYVVKKSSTWGISVKIPSREARTLIKLAFMEYVYTRWTPVPN
jgi:hypothetical protein